MALLNWQSSTFADLMEKLDSLLLSEEMYKRQHSHTTWLKKGDRNTKWFLKKVSNRRRKNAIKRLRDESGEWQESLEGIEATVLDYLSNIFKLQGVLPNALHSVLEATIPSVLIVANKALLAQITAEEVKTVVF